jgi:hypothetical protein
MFRQLRAGWRVMRGRLAPSRALPDKVLFIPGHTLGWTSLRPAVSHLLSNPRNGAVAAVYSARDGRFHENGPTGRIMTGGEVRATRLVTVEFSNARAGRAVKSREIADAVHALRRVEGGGPEAMRLRVVTHSAGDPHFRAALLDHIDPARDRVRFTGQVAVGPIIDGSWTGNVGGKRAGALLGMRTAASELAEGSPMMSELAAAREAIDAKIEGPRVDVQIEGAPTPRLRGRPHIATGDGFVATRWMKRPGARTLVLRGLDPLPTAHLYEIRYSGVIKTIEEALTTPAP